MNSVRLKRIFDAFDCNDDGQISVDELGHALERLGLTIPLPDLEPTIRGFMEDRAGGLDFDGFAALDRSLGHQFSRYDAPGTEGVTGEEKEEELKDAFKVFDENGDGFISAVELKSVLARLRLADGDDVEQMICKVDKNSDGLVDFEEFVHMMTSDAEQILM
jgi:calcium-binding protein CML